MSVCVYDYNFTINRLVFLNQGLLCPLKGMRQYLGMEEMATAERRGSTRSQGCC